jgi:hypothetical protein
MSRKHLPAAVLVSIGCSVAFNAAPRARTNADDVLQVPDAARQAVDPRDHEHVALAEEIEHGPQFLPAVRRGAAALLLS